MELLKVDASTKWLAHIIHGRLSHLKQPGSASGGVGKMDGISIYRRDLQLQFPRTGGWGERLLHSSVVCRMELWTSVNQRLSGGLDGWCVTMKGVLLVLRLDGWCV